MPRDTDKKQKMMKKNKQGVSDSENESECEYIEDTVRENPDVSAKEINNMIQELFPLKSKEEKKQQLEKIKAFKKKQKAELMKQNMKKNKNKKNKNKKNKRSKQSNKKRKTNKKETQEDTDNSTSEEEDSSDNSDDENRKLKLKSSFDTLKKMKRLKTRGKSNELVEAINMRATGISKRPKKTDKKRDGKKRDGKKRWKKKKDIQYVESEEEDEDEDYTEESEYTDVDSDSDYFPENEDEELDDDELDMLKDGNMKFNIIFTTGGPGGSGAPMIGMDEFGDFGAGLEDEFMNGSMDEYGDEYDDVEEYITSSDDDKSDEEEDDKISNKKKSASPKSKKKTKFVKNEVVLVKLKEWDDFYKGKIASVRRFKNKLTKKVEVTYDIELDDDEYEMVCDVPSTRMRKVNKESLEFEELIEEMRTIASTKKKGKKAFEKKINKMVKAVEKKKKKEEKKESKKKKKKHITKFKSLLKSKGPMNEVKYFNGLSVEQQKIILKKMKDLNKYDNVEKPYRLQLIESEIPVEYKSCAIKKINSLAYMDPGTGEYYKIKQWVDTFMKIPFNKHNRLPITMADGPEKCVEFMGNAKSSLDKAVYGLDDAKMQIMQIVGQWISNPESVGNAIAIQGPMGTGKTTLVKDGISKILNRPFAFLALGGATDSSFLEGHSYTYEGSSWGKIVDILLTSKCMNPVIYFDELDKISSTPKGEEIVGILTHLTDLTQNSQYHDKYFSNIDFDLSKALFIFSYNDESKVNKILLDRMYKIKTKGYDTKQKITIANNYLIPAILKNINFKEEDIVFPQKTLEHIINEHTEDEKGVRNLKRALEIIYSKLNLYRLMKEDTTLFENQKTFKVKFPHTVTIEHVNAFIKKKDSTTRPPFGMYV